ncbi:MAG: hypothetical protein JNM19_18485, partial [Chitinophagaceae bacterium]|nr:hypothetical protein [Chitinophagaceae bacterium]
MKWLKTTLLSIITLCTSYLVNAAGLKSIYTLPCGVNSYTIIPVAAVGATAPYTLYAADGVTVIAGPQASNVFSNITGTVGDNLVVGVISVFNGSTLYTTITLNGGTSVLNGAVNCACTLGIPEVCYALLGSDQIAGATYTWTSPSGIVFNQSGLTVPQQPPENGVWTVNASVVVGTCTHVLNNSFVLANCNSAFPVLFNYVRSVSTNCKIMAEWSTAQENNSDRFEIETSEDGNTGWRKVVTIAAAGNSNTNIQYSAEVPVGEASVVFIRLRQVDKDG